MKVVFWEKALLQLAMVEVVDKQTNSTGQGVRATRKRSGGMSEASEVMPKFSIVSFNGKCVGFAFRDCASPK